MRRRAQGRASPTLVLCRQCVEYVFEREEVCPHCGGDPRRAGARYLAAGHAEIEAIKRIERAIDRRRAAPGGLDGGVGD